MKGRWCVAAFCLAIALSACSTSDDEGKTPVSRGSSTATSAPPGSTTTEESGSLTGANSQLITDGVCQVVIPDDWVDDGTGRGTTPGGARFVLFGGRIRNDADWQAARDVVATPGAGTDVTSISRDEGSIRVVYAGDLGFEYRKRFDDKYCDFSVTSTRTIPEGERRYWDAVISSLAPNS